MLIIAGTMYIGTCPLLQILYKQAIALNIEQIENGSQTAWNEWEIE